MFGGSLSAMDGDEMENGECDLIGYADEVSCSCHLCLHACNQSLFARGLSIDFPAYVISQHAHWPIRTPPPTCAN